MDKTPRENFREMQKQPFSVRMQYFWEYYKWHTIITIAVIAMAISLISAIVNQKDSAFSALFVNAYALEESEAFRQEFIEYADIHLDEETCDMTTSYFDIDYSSENSIATRQYILTHVASGELDVFAVDETNFQESDADMLLDLRTVLPEQTIEAHSDRLYWVFSEDAGAEIPVALRVEDAARLTNAYALPQGSYLLGFCASSQNTDKAPLFIDYLFS